MHYFGPEVGYSFGVLVVLSSDIPERLIIFFKFRKLPIELLNSG